MEMVAAILYQLTRDIPEEKIKDTPFANYFVDHTTGVYPIAASGTPFDMKYIGVKGDPIADLNEDLAAEQKARVTYDNILRLTDDPDVRDPIKFLREREIVHYQRFGEAKREVSSKYPGSGKPTPAPFCNRKTKIQKMYELKPDLGVLLPTSNAPFSFHK